MRINRNETLRILNKNKKGSEINKLIVKYNLDNDLYNANKKQFINFLCFIRIKNIILLSMIISIIIGLIIFFISYHSYKNNKINISFKQYINNTNIDGYYIPKDKVSEPIYKKCPIENCKRCYGNSYNDTCTSCINPYNPIIDENNKIISCEYNPTNLPTKTYITFNETEKLNFTYNLINVSTNYITIKTTDKDNFIEIKTDFPAENVSDKKTESTIEESTDNRFSTKNETSNRATEFELLTEKTIDNTFSTINESSNKNIMYKTTEFVPSKEIITDNIFSTINNISNEIITKDTVRITSSQENSTKEEFTSDIPKQTSILSKTFTEIISVVKTEFPSRIY